MKITINPNSIPFISKESSYGLKTFASFRRIVETMVATDEIRLKAGETISEVTINERGLVFTIEEN